MKLIDLEAMVKEHKKMCENAGVDWIPDNHTFYISRDNWESLIRDPALQYLGPGHVYYLVNRTQFFGVHIIVTP